jgi:chemotaxis response regulator CheB
MYANKAMKAKSAVKDFPIVCVGGSAGGLDAYTRSAMVSGCIDFVLSPEDIAKEIVRITHAAE